MEMSWWLHLQSPVQNTHWPTAHCLLLLKNNNITICNYHGRDLISSSNQGLNLGKQALQSSCELLRQRNMELCGTASKLGNLGYLALISSHLKLQFCVQIEIASLPLCKTLSLELSIKLPHLCTEMVNTLRSPLWSALWNPPWSDHNKYMNNRKHAF